MFAIYNEAKAIIAHELSHQAKYHTYKKLGIYIALAAGTGFLMKNFKTIKDKVVVAYLASVVSVPMTAYFSRYFEKEADLNALKSVNAKDLISSLKALKKSMKGNKIEIFRDSKFMKKIKQKLFGSHPTNEEREKYLLAAGN